MCVRVCVRKRLSLFICLCVISRNRSIFISVLIAKYECSHHKAYLFIIYMGFSFLFNIHICSLPNNMPSYWAGFDRNIHCVYCIFVIISKKKFHVIDHLFACLCLKANKKFDVINRMETIDVSSNIHINPKNTTKDVHKYILKSPIKLQTGQNWDNNSIFDYRHHHRQQQRQPLQHHHHTKPIAAIVTITNTSNAIISINIIADLTGVVLWKWIKLIHPI